MRRMFLKVRQKRRLEGLNVSERLKTDVKNNINQHLAQSYYVIM